MLRWNHNWCVPILANILRMVSPTLCPPRALNNVTCKKTAAGIFTCALKHSLDVKVWYRIFNTNVKLVLIYGCETWKTIQSQYTTARSKPEPSTTNLNLPRELTELLAPYISLSTFANISSRISCRLSRSG